MATLFGSLFVFMLIIGLHEFGHFYMAKKAGIRVNEFSIGMGPQVFNKKRGGTTYSLRALPIGGFVAMEGEDELSSDPRSFNNASIGKRLAVVASGAGMNFVLAIVAFFLYTAILGYPTGTPVIGSLQENMPATEAGMVAGDKIISINDREVSKWEDISKIVSEEDSTLKILVDRGGETLTFSMESKEENGSKFIGVSPVYERDILRSVKDGFVMTGAVIVSIIEVLKNLFTGAFSLDALSGPVGVVQVIGQTASNGFAPLLMITGFISANLGFMNLLPIPALDGGKIVFLLIEALRGKPLSEKIEMNLSLIGIALLFGLMIYVTIFGDLARIIG